MAGARFSRAMKVFTSSDASKLSPMAVGHRYVMQTRLHVHGNAGSQS